MFLFCHTEQRYYDMNDAHSSWNKFIELRGSLWNQANARPRKLAGNTLHNKRSLLHLGSSPNYNEACDCKDQQNHRTWKKLV